MEKNEYTFHYNNTFELESGHTLPGFQLKYTTLGKLNKEHSNVIWICHALTGSSDFTEWWKPLFSKEGAFDPEKYFIICANMLGGCYGSTGPLSTDPLTKRPYYHRFPLLTNRDAVSAFDLLREDLRIENIHTLLGGSLGGQQVLEWAIMKPSTFKYIIPLACNAFHSPWGIAFNEAQRLAIAADPTWKNEDRTAGADGLKAARAIGMLSYRHYETFGVTQMEKTIERTDDYKAASYVRYQGQKLVNRFNAFTYWTLSKMMDSHHVGRKREGVIAALQMIQAKALVVGIDRDILFPIDEQKFIAAHIPASAFHEISSLYGHDGFLVEFDQLKVAIQDFLEKKLTGILS